MRYGFKIHKESSGYWAQCVELEGCSTQGDTLEDLHKNMQEALDLYLSEPASSSTIFPKPKSVESKSVVLVPVSASVAFAMKVRQARVKKKFTQVEMARILEMKNLYSYQRLESPKSNPTLETMIKLSNAMEDLNFNDIIEIKKRA